MFNIESTCCLCLKVSVPLSDMFFIDKDGLTYFYKISILTKIINVLVPNLQFKICTKCTETVDMIYAFNETSSKNIKTLVSHNLMLKENEESVQLKFEVNEESDINELVTVKTEPLLQDETICDDEDNLVNFETVNLKHNTDDPTIFYEDIDPLPNNEIDFKIEIEEEGISEDCFYKENKSKSKLEKQNTPFESKSKRKRKYGTRSMADASETMKNAVEIIINENYSLREASRLYKVPLTSLSRYVSLYKSLSDEEKKKLSYEPKYNIFSSKMEEEFKNYVLMISQIQNGLTKIECRLLAFVMADKYKLKMPKSWKTKNMAGEHWFKRFSERWPEIIFTKPDPTNLDRAKIFNEENLRKYFDNIVHASTIS